MYQAGQLVQYKERCFYVVGSGSAPSVPDVVNFTIPKQARFVYFMLIGAGGGGGGGAVATANKAGCGGGGSGAVTSAIYSARTLPANILIQVSTGGTGALGATTLNANGNNGNAGGAASIGVNVQSSQANLPGCILFASPGQGGGANTGNSVGTGGAGGSTTSAALAATPFVSRAISYNNIAGSAGGSGSTATTTPANYGYVGLTCGGAGSAGLGAAGSSVNNGGSIAANNTENIFLLPLNTILVRGGARDTNVQGGNVGYNGYSNILESIPFATNTPLFSLGGGGAGSDSILSTGDIGGNGDIGCGGGAGAPGITTGGAGGNGGPAFCLIEWW
jgi:hypothetical protein